jgi:hypothetical protein
MTPFIDNFIGALSLAARVSPFIFFLACAILTLLPKYFRENVLQHNRDGMRLFFFGLSLIVVGGFVQRATAMVTLAGFSATLVALGVLIWLNDSWTAKVFPLALAPAYLVLAIASYILGAGHGSADIGTGFNQYAFVSLIIPVFTATLAGTMTVYSMLSEDFKKQIFPKDNSGGRLFAIGLVALLVASFSVNPLLTVALSAFATTLMAFGGLIAAPEPMTNQLLRTKWVVVYGLATIAIFVLAF